MNTVCLTSAATPYTSFICSEERIFVVCVLDCSC